MDGVAGSSNMQNEDPLRRDEEEKKDFFDQFNPPQPQNPPEADPNLQDHNFDDHQFGDNQFNQPEGPAQNFPAHPHANQSNDQENLGGQDNKERQSLLKPPQQQQQPHQLQQGVKNYEQLQMENRDLIRWRNVNLCLIMFIVFLTIFFLQVLAYLLFFTNCRFLKNSVPQINGVLVPIAASVTYFIMSLFTLFFLYLQYEIVNYGYRSGMFCWRIFAPIYGVILLLLGVLLIALELPKNADSATSQWAVMSNNQKLFFDNDLQSYEKERSQNILLCGIFGIVIGILIIVSVAPFHMLYSLVTFSYKPATISRMPVIEGHESVKFVYTCIMDQEREYFSMTGLMNVQEQPKEEVKKEEADIERDQQFNDEQMELQRIEEQKLIQEYGVVPGQGDDQFQNYQSDLILKGPNLQGGPLDGHRIHEFGENPDYEFHNQFERENLGGTFNNSIGGNISGSYNFGAHLR